jgi:hypothetical protein
VYVRGVGCASLCACVKYSINGPYVNNVEVEKAEIHFDTHSDP